MAKEGKDESLLNDLVAKSETIDGITIHEYVELLKEDARPARTAYQRAFDMIEGAGKKKFKEFKKDLIRYDFFSALDEQGYTADSVFGLEKNLMELVNHFKGAALKLGAEKRVLLMHGPVGSAKSTIARLIKKGLEEYSMIHPLFSLEWIGLGPFGKAEVMKNNIVVDRKVLFDQVCQMHEDPIKLLSQENRKAILRDINEANKGKEMLYEVEIDGDLCPHCRFNYTMLMKHYNGDWNEIMKHVRINRIFLSEADRIGIGTFQPRDEKNQDSTELTGNIDYRKIATIGSDSDPRAFNFDGELCIANRGIVEFIEILKLETAFLYDLLGASQEHLIKPKKKALTYIDEIILGHTNEEEFRKLQNNPEMEAFRDRTKRIDIPYNVKLSNEIAIYEKDYNKRKVSKHIAPHTLEMVAMWAILTRLDSPKEEASGTLSRMQKLRLYNGEHLPKYTEDTVKKLKEDTEREGLDGISPRFIQNAIYEAITGIDLECVNPFQVIGKLKNDLKTSTLINSEEDKKDFAKFLDDIEGEYEEIIKDEIQRAISADEDEMQELCDKYLLNIKSFCRKEKIRNPITGKDEVADENFMKSIEDFVPVEDSNTDGYRSGLLSYIGSLQVGDDPQKFKYDSNTELRKAFEKKLFEEKKESINFQKIWLGDEDDEGKTKINKILNRLKTQFDYCDVCAHDVLEYVAGIFAKGDANK